MNAKSIVFITLLTTLASLAVASAAEKPAAEIYLPRTILNRIVETASEPSCPSDPARPLGSKHFTALDDTTLLILLELPDYLCDKSNSIVPLLADVRGRWVLGDHLPGLPVFFGQGPDNALWLATQWQIEGTYPSLFRSENGLHWKEIPLPPGPEPGSPFIFLNNLCFQGNEVLLRLTSESGGATPVSQTYSLDWTALAGDETGWQEIPSPQPNAKVTCSPPTTVLNEWKREASPEPREIVFHREKTRLLLPTVLEGR